jgi:hypothetical protein
MRRTARRSAPPRHKATRTSSGSGAFLLVLATLLVLSSIGSLQTGSAARLPVSATPLQTWVIDQLPVVATVDDPSTASDVPPASAPEQHHGR